MNNVQKHMGVVVPMVTPVTMTGQLDDRAIERVVDFLVEGGIDGIFVLGTTGEGVSVPRAARRKLVEHVVARVKGRIKVYAGIGDLYPKDVAAGNEYFHAGADAVVARPPAAFPLEQLLPWFESLLSGLEGPLLLYNIPSTTNVSIPLEVLEKLIGHPKLLGIKDSENDPKRLAELVRRFGHHETFSIFVGVGALMAQGLKLGAEGIVPSVGNLIPDVCHRLCQCAQRGDWAQAEIQAKRMVEVSALYQRGRSLGQSLAALKAAMSCRGFCTPAMLPPLVPLSESEIEKLRQQMVGLELVDSGRSALVGVAAPASAAANL